MLGDNLAMPTAVVNLYQSKGIKVMRIYAPNSDVLNAPKGTNIDFTMDLNYDDFKSLAKSLLAAVNWVKKNIRAYYPAVSFKYIVVGNEVNGTSDIWNIMPAMKNVYSALSLVRLQNKIKVTTAVFPAVLGTSYPPSAGAFSSYSSLYMSYIVKYLAQTGAPLLANIYPYVARVSNPTYITLDYALFTSSSTVPDGSYKYQNLFDAMVDALYSAMEKVGGPNVRIVVSESGWPTDGGPDASKINAMTYNQNLLKHVGKGTPKRPGPLETYIFSMFNENKKDVGVERNWGLFYPNQKPVYPISFN